MGVNIDNIEILLQDLSVIVKSYEELSAKFISFYINQSRHKYSKVAKYINEKIINDEQMIYFMQSNLNELIKYCNKNESVLLKQIRECGIANKKDIELNPHQIVDKLEKLQDHIDLEEQRISYSRRREDRIFSVKMEQFNKALSTHSFQTKDMTKKLESNLTTSVISVLGIFAAFITTFFGGLSVFGSIMTNLKEVSKFRLCFTILLLGFILFNICFVLLYSISKILDKNIGCRVRFSILYSNTTESMGVFKKICKWIKIKIIRFPMVIAFNAIIFVGIIITIVLKILDFKDVIHF